MRLNITNFFAYLSFRSITGNFFWSCGNNSIPRGLSGPLYITSDLYSPTLLDCINHRSFALVAIVLEVRRAERSALGIFKVGPVFSNKFDPLCPHNQISWQLMHSKSLFPRDFHNFDRYGREQRNLFHRFHFKRSQSGPRTTKFHCEKISFVQSATRTTKFHW